MTFYGLLAAGVVLRNFIGFHSLNPSGKGLGKAARGQILYPGLLGHWKKQQDVQCWKTSQDVQCWKTSQDVQYWKTSQDVPCWKTSQDVQYWRKSQDGWWAVCSGFPEQLADEPMCSASLQQQLWSSGRWSWWRGSDVMDEAIGEIPSVRPTAARMEA
ncbi:collagen alpha chain-like [Diaporthe amygdali]|uniref:uncharacterized protein n=1 Tax=Phomopsis amygdali TaxID=1214568 RepID=UPI0022FE4426|nr:uncharacterized protein J7T55_015347 [Diaporthe amygdali]KAJ0120617.1 collagen alpha chain-like [Diaporthe amygdali]